MLQYPFTVEFEKELASDAGGESRDAFSAVYDQAYQFLFDFDGSSFLHPATHACVDMQAFPVLGAVMSHAYLAAGVFPDCIGFPCLAAALLGYYVKIPDSVMRECFLCSLSTYETSVFHNALSCSGAKFSAETERELTSILANHGVRGIPKPSNLNQLLLQVSRYTFLIQPAAALHMIMSGVPESHCPFWRCMTVEKLYLLFKSMMLSHGKF